MADMNAMFAARKKKGKKSRNVNFNQILDNVDLIENETQLVQEFDEEGNVVSLDEVALHKPVASGSLTAAVEANKKKENAGSIIQVAQGAAELAQGEWVDDQHEEKLTSFLGANSKRAVTDLDGLSSSKPNETKSSAVLEQEEQSKKMFHWTRKQAIEESTRTKPKEEEVKKPAFFRPREMMQNKEGAAALKELGNEKVFPSLGGPSSSAQAVTSGSAWGVIKQDAIKEFQVKQEDGEYLDADFIAAEEFEGKKPGYAFKLGHEGLGYYWEGPLQESDSAFLEVPEIQQGVVATPKVQTPVDPPAAPAVKEPSPEELAEQQRIDAEKEAKRKAKKAEKERQKAEWERQQREAKEREEQEELLKQQASNNEAKQTAAPAPIVEPSVDRFATLKKKKKKAPKA